MVGTRRTWAPRLDATAAVKPSPPSDMGISTTSASGTTARTPRAMAAAASAAVIDSLKESGALSYKHLGTESTVWKCAL